MAVNVEVQKNPNENAMGLIRRFTKRVQGSGVLPRVRSIRYRDRPISKELQKKRKLKRLQKTARFDELLKLGKITERPERKKWRRR